MALAGGHEAEMAWRQDDRPPSPPRGYWKWGGGLALLGLLFALALPALLRAPRTPGGPTPSPSLAPRRSLAVLGFANLSRRRDADWIATALSEALASGLAAGAKLRLIPAENVAQMKAELGLADLEALTPEVLSRVASHLGVDLIILGSYMVTESREERQIRLDLRLQETRTGRTLATVAETGSEAAIADLVSRSEGKVRESLGIGTPASAEAGGARAALPSSPEAARLYAEGLARLRVFDALSARELLERANEVDPNHPLLHLALAEAWSVLGYDARAKGETRKAFDLSGGLPLADRLVIEARHREVIGERAKAAETWRSLWSLYPDSLDYGLRLAAAQTASGQRKEAMATVEALRRLPRPLVEDPRIDMEESRAATSLGDYRRGQVAAARAAQKGSARGARLLVARARLLEAYALRGLGEPGGAVAAAEEARALHAAAGDRHGVCRAIIEAAAILRYQGKLEEARRLSEEALVLARQIGDRGGAAMAGNRIASVLAEQGHLAQARRVYEETLTAWREIGEGSGEGTALNNIGETLWKQGDLSAARKALESSVALFRQIDSRRGRSFSLSNLGFVLRDQGDLAGARAAHEESLAWARQIDEKSLVAVALHGLGAVLTAQGDLEGARQSHEEAFGIRRGLGEKGREAESLVALAALSLEAGRAAQAEAMARDAVKELLAGRVGHSEARAWAILAESLIAQGKRAEALDALGRATAAADRTEYRLFRLSVALVSARVEALASRRAEAVRALKAVLSEATARGAVGLALEARLALGEIDLRSGDLRAGRASLAELEREARNRGFGLIADKAARQSRPDGPTSPARP